MQESRFSNLIKITVFAGDVIFLNALYLGLYFIGHLIIHPVDQSWFLFLILTNITWLVVLFYTNPYKIFRIVKIGQVAGDVTFAVFQHFLITSTTLYLLQILPVHWWSLMAVYGIFLLVSLSWRATLIYSLRWLRYQGKNVQNVVIVGEGLLSHKLRRFFQKHPEYGYAVARFFDIETQIKGKASGLDELYQYILQNNIEEVYCCVPNTSYKKVRDIINWSEDKFIKVKILNDFRAFPFKGVELEKYDNIPILSVTSLPLDDKRNQLLKRIFDVVISTVFIVFIGWWLFIIIGLLIKVNSKGPVFFKQQRAGRNNTRFYCYKFRTMYVNEMADKIQATRNDPRITKIGIVLRKTSLDELPQFINVLRGEMSVIGPRPHPILLNEIFSNRIVKFMSRHSVKPGITGLAQVKGYRGETQELHDMKGRYRLDIFYIENWSIILDIKIVLQTFFHLFTGDEKAY